jgi:hypothetical protein
MSDHVTGQNPPETSSVVTFPKRKKPGRKRQPKADAPAAPVLEFRKPKPISKPVVSAQVVDLLSNVIRSAHAFGIDSALIITHDAINGWRFHTAGVHDGRRLDFVKALSGVQYDLLETEQGGHSHDD